LYAHLSPDALKTEKNVASPASVETDLPAAPLAPILQVREESLMLQVLRRDPSVMDRVRMEFAGLCNQVISADHVRVSEAEDLVKACRKVAGYINVALERLAGKDPAVAEDFIRGNPLERIFRVGFSVALELRWEAERWLKEAWFVRQGLKPGFWEDWGGTLVGIMQKKPLSYK
jgi:hypothetical protein